MLGRRTTGGAVLCPSCRKLVGAGESRCPFCGYSSPGRWGLLPALRQLGGAISLWPLAAGGCFLFYLAMLAVDPQALGGGRGVFGLLSPSLETLVSFGGSGATPVLRLGRWWTVFSAGWLHANLLHILFNVMAIRQLAPAVEQIYGGGRAVVIYVLSGAAGFLFSTLSPFAPRLVQAVMGGGGGVSVGASAAVFGLLGALIHFSRRGGSRATGQYVWTWVIALFVFGIVVPGIDNWAHLGGFLGGWLLSFLVDPLRPERPFHVGLAVLCVAASAAALAWSLITAAQVWR
jgi:rhomboid protease GluP